MTNINSTILNKCIDVINESSSYSIYNKYYKNKENVKVFVRENAERYTSDWVGIMEHYKGKICEIGYAHYDDLFGTFILEVILYINKVDYQFDFEYKSLIPMEMIENFSKPSYQPRTFITESNEIDMINESYIFDNNISMGRKIIMDDIKPKPAISIGDKVRIKPDSLKYYNDEEWMDKNIIGHDTITLEFITDCIENNKEIEVLGKFKGGTEEKYPWWSMVHNDFNGGQYSDKTYITDLFFIDNSIPSYKPKKFIYENINPINEEAINEFKKDYYITETSTVEEIEKHYNVSFEQYFNDLYSIDLQESHESDLKMYSDNIKKLNVDGLLLKKEFFDKSKKDLLVSKLYSIGFDRASSISNWHGPDVNKCAVILFNNADNTTNDTRLDGMNCYNSNIGYMMGHYKEVYSESTLSDLMSLDEVIRFIDTKIIINPSKMYEPRKFIYENDKWYPYRFKTDDEMKSDFGDEWENHEDFQGAGWNPNMNKLLGTVYPFELSELNKASNQPISSSYHPSNGDEKWTITWGMLTDNEKEKKPSYEPKKFIYESLDDKELNDYLKKEKELPFNTILYRFNKENDSEEKLEELTLKLKELDFDMAIQSQNSILNDGNETYILIVLHTIENTRGRSFTIDKGRVYTTSDRYISNLGNDLPNLKIEKFENIDDIIKLFRNLTMKSPSYQPKKFIYENNVRKLNDF